MLSEAFVTSVLSSSQEGSKKSSHAKDVGIFIQNLQPTQTIHSTLKNSSTGPHCLALTETHVYAAQAEKAVVHVYSREKNNQEVTVPFPERIHSVSFVGGYEGGGAGVLALGTQGGRIILWEVATGRQVTTPASHLQPVAVLATDFTSNFLLSGSEDSNIHVWSINTILSFSRPSENGLSTSASISPWRTLSNHHGPITSIVAGHSKSASNIAVSASKDGSCTVWDYQVGHLLRTFVLSKPPISLALDPCDRAFYAGHEDGTIQLINFFKPSSIINPLHDESLQGISTQAPASDLWDAASQNLGATLCLDVVYEGNYLLSGHESGKVCVWDVASGKYVKELADHGTAVTNLLVLPPTGFLSAPAPKLTLHQVVKPRYESSFSSASSQDQGIIPLNYSLTAHFTSTIPSKSTTYSSTMDEAFHHPALPKSYLAASLASLASSINGSSSANGTATAGDEYLKRQVSELQTTLEDLRATHKQTWKKMVEMRMERIRWEKEERARRERRKERKDEDGSNSSSWENEDSSEDIDPVLDSSSSG